MDIINLKGGLKRPRQDQEFTHENELVESSSTATATATEEYCSEKEVLGGKNPLSLLGWNP